MKDIFEFNHIDRCLSEPDIKTHKDFYSHYHKKYWCFKRSYKRYKLLDETVSISGIISVATGTIAGGLTLNPIILGVVNGAGIVVVGIGKKKNYKRVELHLRRMKKFLWNCVQLFEETHLTNKSLLIE